jgi:hypothetical protein
MAAEATKITRADIPKHARRIAIFADCSSSMTDGCESFYNMQTALNNLWPIAGAELYGYSAGWFSTHRVNSPDDLRPSSRSTAFAPILRKAARINADMTFIFSDGIPADAGAMWRVWNSTSFPIATHLCLPESWVSSNQECAQLMRALCRGGGQLTCGDSIPQLQNGVSQAMADDDYNRRCGARRLPDYTDQLQTGVERARNKANVNKRIIELGNELSDVQHDVGELQGRATIAGSLEKVFANLDGMAVEAFDVQRSRSAADKAAWAEQHEGLAHGLLALGARILGRVKGEYEETLRGDPARDARSERAAAVQIGRVSLNKDVLHRSAAISTARSPRAAALPAPSERPSLAIAPPRERPSFAKATEDMPVRQSTVERPVVVVRRRRT